MKNKDIGTKMDARIDPVKKRRKDDARWRKDTRLDLDPYDDKAERIDRKDDPLIVMAFYLCGFFKWSFQEFLDTPPFIRREFFNMLKERSNDLTKYVGFDEAAGYKQLQRMFPENKD